MAVTSGKYLGVGTRYVVVYELNADGYPNAATTSAYTGLEIAGPQAFSLTIPEPRKITHTGSDRVLGVDYLPPLESISAEVRAAPGNLPLDAVLRAVTNPAVGEMSTMAEGTSQQGSEPRLGFLFFQQAIDLDTGDQRWAWWIFPKAKVIPLPGGAGDSPESTRYMIAPTPVTKHLWGRGYSIAIDGCTSAQADRGMSQYKPRLVSFLGNNSSTAFNFPSSSPAADVAKVTVWKNGTLQVVTTDYTVSTIAVTFTTAPALGDNVVVLYETNTI